MQSDELKDVGLKATQPRLKILSILEQNRDRHMSAEDVYRALMTTGDDLGLATIYRVLTQFESAGLVIRHHFAEGHAVFELDSGEHHDHIVCIDCGRVTEFVDNTIERRQIKIAKEHGFRLADHSLVLHGTLRTQALRTPQALIRTAFRRTRALAGAPLKLRARTQTRRSERIRRRILDPSRDASPPLLTLPHVRGCELAAHLVEGLWSTPLPDNHDCR